MKRGLFIGIGVILAGIGAGAFFMSQSARSKSTDTLSSAFADDSAKIQFLKKYVKLNSEISAAEFHIRYHDNSQGVPGPSDYDMQIIMKMPTENLPLWITGMKQTQEPVDFSWARKLALGSRKWAVASKPATYENGRTTMAVFRPEGIVYKRISSN